MSSSKDLRRLQLARAGIEKKSYIAITPGGAAKLGFILGTKDPKLNQSSIDFYLELSKRIGIPIPVITL